jgi:hypothetical protein
MSKFSKRRWDMLREVTKFITGLYKLTRSISRLVMFCTPTSSPSLRALPNCKKVLRKELNVLTVLFLILWFLTLLANHSPAVTPQVLLNREFSGFAADSAIIAYSLKGSRTTASPGLVKKTKDHRSYLACSPGGDLKNVQPLINGK